MPFSCVRAQETAVATLTRALRAGRVHHAYRFEGPEGVGKELCALALAQALVCEGGDPLGCGACQACERAVGRSPDPPHTPLHPDVILVERGLYAPETIGRSRPELTELSVDQVRRIILPHAAFPPHAGRSRVFIVRRAEELSVSAANALLKTLEEPRAGTHFVLLTSRPDRLLDTIRSRTLPVRFAPLPDEIMRDILRAHDVPEERHALAIELGAGSASAALEHADGEASAARDAFLATMRDALMAKDLGAAVALTESADRDRAALRRDLAALGAALARQTRAEVVRNPRAASLAARRYQAVLGAIERVERHASPNLTLASLIAEMRTGIPGPRMPKLR